MVKLPDEIEVPVAKLPLEPSSAPAAATLLNSETTAETKSALFPITLTWTTVVPGATLRA